MKYAITGHLGLIGGPLKARLDRLGHKCSLAVDLRNYSDVRNMINYEKKDIDILFHLAAFCKINQSIEYPEIIFDNNVEGINSVLEFCRKNKVKKIIFFSSSRVLNKEKNPYTASKVYGEELVKAYFQCYGINYLVIRPSSVYGPGDDKTHRLIDIWINNARDGKPLIIYGDKNKVLTFTYIDDFLDALEIALKESNKEISISGKEEVKLIDLAKEIIKQTSSNSTIIFKDPELAQPQKTHVENTIDYDPKVNIKEGIRRCLKC